MGLEFRRAAHLLMTMIKVTIDRGELPGSWAALKAVLKEPIMLSILAWLKLALLKGILTSNPLFLRPEISSLAFWLSTVASPWVSSSSCRSATAPMVSCTAWVYRDFSCHPTVDGDDVLDCCGQGSCCHILQRTDLKLAGEIIHTEEAPHLCGSSLLFPLLSCLHGSLPGSTTRVQPHQTGGRDLAPWWCLLGGVVD